MSYTYPQDFEAFYKHFLRSHTHPAVRWSHVLALGCLGIGGLVALRRRQVWPLVLGGAGFAALAVLSHPVFTGSWPENLGHPILGGRAFLRLCLRTITGEVHKDLEELQKEDEGMGSSG